jgi:hypothetical protein
MSHDLQSVAVRRARDPALESWHGRGENPAAGRTLFTSGPAPMGQRVSGNIRMKWRRHRQALMTRRTAATGGITDL